MATMRLVHEDQTELRFAHGPLAGVIFLVVGGLMAYLSFEHIADDRTARWLVGGMGVVFAAAGLSVALWRDELTIDLLSRTYRGRRGFWPSPRPFQDALDQMQGVVLDRIVRHSSSGGRSRRQTLWRVSLDLGDRKARVLETGVESQAFQRHEHLARTLRLPAIDRTGVTENRRGWEELDRSLADEAREQGEEISAPGPPPPGSRILWEPAGGMAFIVLPKSGVTGGTIFLALFGLTFAAFGAMALLILSGAWDVPTSGSRAVGWAIGGLFLFFGLAIVLLAVWGSQAQEVVREKRDGLLFYTTLLGYPHLRHFIPRREIEDVSLRAASSGRRRKRLGAGRPREVRKELLVRSDEELVKLGSDLTPEEQEWLHQAVRFLAAR